MITLFEKFNYEFKTFDLSDDDLIRIAEWGLYEIGEYSSSCYDEYEDIGFKNPVDCILSDFKKFISIDYPKELGNVPDNLIIYRFVNLKNESELNRNEIGVSWFSDPDAPNNGCFFQMLEYLGGQDTYLIKAKTNIDNVDIKRTLWERTTQWCENEIRVIKDNDKDIEILEIKKY